MKKSSGQFSRLLEKLKSRFMENPTRHKGIKWNDVALRLRTDRMKSLEAMESTGGEPDVVGRDKKTGEYIFMDCAAESPKGRRSLCYDRQALDSRKQAKPKNDAISMAKSLGIEILNEEQYRELQKLGQFDTKSSSWVITPPEVRKLGGALFCDRRYDMVFTYHNGADSYYAARGFRGLLRV